jgi:hypothetical protein
MKLDNDSVAVVAVPQVVTRVPGERRLSILAVSGPQCRWPVADDPTVIGGILLCGAHTEATYCAAHRKLAYADRQQQRARAHAHANRTPQIAAPTGKATEPARREAA